MSALILLTSEVVNFWIVKIAKKALHVVYKYRSGLQKGFKKRNYCFLFVKYDVSAFQRTFDRFHIFKNGKVTSGLSFVSSARKET